MRTSRPALLRSRSSRAHCSAARRSAIGSALVDWVVEGLGAEERARGRAIEAHERRHVRKACEVLRLGKRDLRGGVHLAPGDGLADAPEADEAGQRDDVPDAPGVHALVEEDGRLVPIHVQAHALGGRSQRREPDGELDRVAQLGCADRREPQIAEDRCPDLEPPEDAQRRLIGHRPRAIEDRDVQRVGQARVGLRDVRLAEPERPEELVGRDPPVLHELDERIKEPRRNRVLLRGERREGAARATRRSLPRTKFDTPRHGRGRWKTDRPRRCAHRNGAYGLAL